MKREDLSQTLKRRFETNSICPICNLKITDDEKILITIKRRRRFKVVTFYHERCLINGETSYKEYED